MLPQLLVVGRALMGSDLPNRLLLERRTPGWLLKILSEQFGYDRDRIEFYDPAVERIVLKRAILPPLVNSPYGFHPVMNDLVDGLLARLRVAKRRGAPRRFFITRQLFQGSESLDRHCLNEGALVRIATQHGFSVSGSRAAAVADQISLFRRAAIVVGQAGSGLHNALFSVEGSRIASIGALTRAQSYIGALRGHDNAFLRVPDETPGMYAVDGTESPGDYTVDEKLFDEFLTAVTAGFPPRSG